MAEQPSSDIATWLEATRAGLGIHAPVLVAYGASTVADLADLDEADFEKLSTLLAASPAPPAPLQLKQIMKALRGASAPKRLPGTMSRITTPPTLAMNPSSARARSSSACADNSESDDSDDESEEDEDSDDEPEGEAALNASRKNVSRPITARPRSWKGKAAGKASVVAAANGMASIPQLFGRSSSANNRHGLGGQASAAAAAAGRARPFGGLGQRSKGHLCVNPCGEKDRECKCPPEATYPHHCTGSHHCARQHKQLLEGAVLRMYLYSMYVYRSCHLA